MSISEEIRFGEDGLIPVAITDVETRRLLVLCYMNAKALGQTIAEGRVYTYSRSRGRVVLKGATSGHVQSVKEIRLNCDGNSLEICVVQEVAACHAGYYSCFYRKWNASDASWSVDDERVFDPDRVYA